MPTDGRTTSQPLFTASLTGSELFMLVSPGNASQGVNYKMLSSTLASFILPNGATALPLVGNGPLIAPSYQALTPAGITTAAVINGYLATSRIITSTGTSNLSTTDCRVLFSTGSGTCFAIMPNAQTANGPILIKDIAGVAGSTTPIKVLFTSGQLADNLATVTIQSPYGAYWLNPLTNGTGSWYLTAG